MLARFALASVAVAIASVPAAATERAPSSVYQSVQRVSCGQGTGTAVVVAPNNIVTASHVVAGDSCQIARGDALQPFTVQYDDPSADLILASTPGRYASQLVVSCAGIVVGERYWLVGYPGGQRTPRTVSVRAESDTRYDVRTETGISRGLQAVAGRSSGGMSGGAVVDAEGQLVAIISAVPASGERVTLVKPLRDTPFCEGR